MFSKHFVIFTDSKKCDGPFFTFEAAFSHVAKHQKDCRIEDETDKVLATWSLWTGLVKTNVTYKYLVIDNEFNRANFPDLVGQLLDKAPAYAMVRDVEVAA